MDYLAYGGCCFGLDRNLKYNKITIKNSYFISLLVGLSGPRLKKKYELNSISLQPYKTHNELEIGTILHAHILTAHVGK